MHTRPWILLTATLGAAVLLAARGSADQPPPDPTPKEGVEVQARGPVHEAFAELTAEAQPTKVVPKQPPKPLQEMPPEEKRLYSHRARAVRALLESRALERLPVLRPRHQT